jgi:hypothetical protein
MIVVDTNIIAYLHITGKFTPLVIQLIEKDSNWIAPPLWQSEFRNVLINTIRHNLMTLEQGIELLNDALLTMQNREICCSCKRDKLISGNSRSSTFAEFPGDRHPPRRLRCVTNITARVVCERSNRTREYVQSCRGCC